MKKIFLLPIVILFCCVNMLGQESEKRVEEDGFEWYLLKDSKGLRGVKDVKGKTIIPISFQSIWYESGLFKANKDALIGIYDTKGKCIISPDRGYTSIYKSGDIQKGYYYSVKKDNCYGVCDLNGKEIISPSVGYTSIFKSGNSEKGFCFFVKKDKNEGVCDINGKEIISPSVGYTSIYKSGDIQMGFYYEVKKGEFCGVCNLSGHEIISPNKGYTSIYKRGDDKYGYHYEANKDNLTIIIDLNGQKISSRNQTVGSSTMLEYEKDGSTELSLLKDKYDGFTWYRVKMNGKYGAMDAQKNIIVPIEYDEIEYVGYHEHKDGDWGYDGCFFVNHHSGVFTKYGECVIPTSREYSQIERRWQKGMGIYYGYKIESNNVIGIVDEYGDEVVSFSDIDQILPSCKNGKYYFELSNWKTRCYGLADGSGKIIINPIHKRLYCNSNGNFVVDINKKDKMLVVCRLSDIYTTYNPFAGQEARAMNMIASENAPAIEDRYAKYQAGKINRKKLLAVTLLATTYGVLQQSVNKQNYQRHTYNNPIKNNYNSVNNYSSDYLTSPAYINQVRARADQSMATFSSRIEQARNQAMINNSQLIERSKKLFSEQYTWIVQFKHQNGRYPTDLEKMEWVKKNYPDMYDSYVSAAAAQYDNSSKDKKEPTINTRECYTCKGSGLCYCAREGHSGEIISHYTSNGTAVYIKHRDCKGTGKCPACNL